MDAAPFIWCARLDSSQQAFRVGAERSIQLSYGRTSMKIVRRRNSAIRS